MSIFLLRASRHGTEENSLVSSKLAVASVLPFKIPRQDLCTTTPNRFPQQNKQDTNGHSHPKAQAWMTRL